jgi:hypothetical protein
LYSEILKYQKQLMPLNTTGSDPIINARFGGIHFGKCTLFLKKPTDTTFSPIATFTNRTSSTFVFEIDPQKVLGAGGTLSNLVGCDVGWTVTFVNLGTTPSTAKFSFDLTIGQDANILTNFSETDSISDTSQTFGSTFTL